MVVLVKLPTSLKWPWLRAVILEEPVKAQTTHSLRTPGLLGGQAAGNHSHPSATSQLLPT